LAKRPINKGDAEIAVIAAIAEIGKAGRPLESNF